MIGFEGSFLGVAGKISARAVMECKICWTPYDPAEGDDFRQVDPGTPFADLPDDWSCPNCGAPKEQFMVLEDPGAVARQEAAEIAEVTDRLVADFTEVWHSTMRGMPLINKALRVEAVGFRRHEGRILGVLITPWFMNLIQLPDGEDWSGLKPGTKEVIGFASGDYEFIHNTREMTGGYKACSLFSPMADFVRQKDASDVARAVMEALFDPAHRAETDRATDIRAAREAELAARADDSPTIGSAPTRRTLITGGISAQGEAR
ncbi:MAG: [NiFe]-hydrogenase assembly chaperone HybE [Rhodobacter sp.]|nr:[NiFe]-hydrogenase assembly chaperone HybE [Rhodobacter sp.]